MEKENLSPAISPGNWIGTFILCAIPIVNLIAMLVWAFDPGINPNKANWAKAILLFYFLIILIVILLYALGLISLIWFLDKADSFNF